MKTISHPFWEDFETVKKFAEREADHRLIELLPSFKQPADTMVLDLGCAGGRNTVVLAKKGFDLFAVDASKAMVEETKSRVADILGKEETQNRIKVRSMDNLSVFENEKFDLVIALGIYHNAKNHSQWEKAYYETVRVLKKDGLLLLSNFGPNSKPEGLPLQPVKNNPNVYKGFGPTLMYLIDSESLDKYLKSFGLKTVTQTDTVSTKTDQGFRETINGLYRKIK